MGKLAARIARLETRVPTLAWLETWFAILREAAQVAGLDTQTRERLLAAITAHHQALAIPPLVEPEQVPILGQALVDGVLAAVRVHVPSAFHAAYGRAAGALCEQTARRWACGEAC